MYTQQLSFKPRAANILSSRQPSCVEELQGEERPARQQAGRHREARNKAGGAAGGRSTTLISSRTHEQHNGGGNKAVAKVSLILHPISLL